MGIRIPRDVSLIARDDAPYLPYLALDVARYRYSLPIYLNRFCRLVQQIATTGEVENPTVRLMPNFHSGESLAPPPAGQWSSA